MLAKRVCFRRFVAVAFFVYVICPLVVDVAAAAAAAVLVVIVAVVVVFVVAII